MRRDMTRDHRLRSMSLSTKFGQRQPEFVFRSTKSSILSGPIRHCVNHKCMSYMSNHEKQCLVDLLAEVLVDSLGDIVSDCVVETVQKQYIKVCDLKLYHIPTTFVRYSLNCNSLFRL